MFDCFTLLQKNERLDSNDQKKAIENLTPFVKLKVEKHPEDETISVKSYDKPQNLVKLIRDYVFVSVDLTKDQKSNYKRLLEIAKDNKKTNWTTIRDDYNKLNEIPGVATANTLHWYKVTQSLFDFWVEHKGGISRIVKPTQSELIPQDALDDYKDILEKNTLDFLNFSNSKDSTREQDFEGLAIQLVKCSKGEVDKIIPITITDQKIVDSIVRTMKKMGEVNEKIQEVLDGKNSHAKAALMNQTIGASATLHFQSLVELEKNIETPSWIDESLDEELYKQLIRSLERDFLMLSSELIWKHWDTRIALVSN
jgi:hypothetical protein